MMPQRSKASIQHEAFVLSRQTLSPNPHIRALTGCWTMSRLGFFQQLPYPSHHGPLDIPVYPAIIHRTRWRRLRYRGGKHIGPHCGGRRWCWVGHTITLADKRCDVHYRWCRHGKRGWRKGVLALLGKSNGHGEGSCLTRTSAVVSVRGQELHG